MSSATMITPPRVSSVAKKKPSEQQPSAGRAIAFRAPPELEARLDAVADGLGLDVSNLVRMILKENLAQYERRVRQLKESGEE